MSRTLKTAINRHIVNKIEDVDGEKNPLWEVFTSQSENVEITITELAEHINRGHPFCAQHNKRKRDSNFLASDILTVDIDKGMTVEQALAEPFVQKYAAMLYTTPSHTPENDRHRQIYQLDRTITDAEEMRMALQGIIRKFGGDQSCNDACRGFFGSKGSNPTIFGNILPNDELEKLIALGSEKRASDRVCCDSGRDLGSKATRLSNDPLDVDQMVRLASSKCWMPLASLEKWTAVHCPKHIDNRPSAYVVKNKSGVNGVRCRTCSAAFWPASELRKKRKPYNFYEIEDFIRGADYDQTPANFYDPDEVGAPAGLLDEVPGERTAHVFNKQYLPEIPLHDGATFVRSPKGSGKSYWLNKILGQCREDGKSVLLVGHRQTLLQVMAKSLGLTCYFYAEDGKMKNNQPNGYYAICVDSIGKLLKPEFDKYDVVIIDESEQVFSHLTADTLRAKRRTCYQKLHHYLRAAKSIIVTDADLGPITCVAIFQAIKDGVPHQIYLNEYKESRCDFHYYESDTHLEEEMIEAIEAGGRHYVATNSKNRAELLLETIRYEFGETRKTMLVTSDTTSDSDVRKFVNNIKTEILNYDVIVASPTLGTGIDITFPDEAQLIDTVFGFFVPRVNNHFDIDQQLARVRHPKMIKAWVAPEQFGFETDPDVIRSEVLDNAALNDTIIGYQDDGRPILDEPYLDLYAHVTAMSRASRNDLRSNFLNLRKRNGWAVTEIRAVSEMEKTGKKRLDTAKSLLEIKRSEAICDATKIDPEVYQALRDRSQAGSMLSKHEKISMRRHEIEAFYREEISPELIAMDDNGRYRDQVRLMEIYLSHWSHVTEKSLADREAGHFVTDTKNEPLKKLMLHTLLCAAGLADEFTPIKTGVIVSKNTLSNFALACSQNATKIQELFDVNVKTKDLHTKTVQHLSKILELIGLENCNAVREKVNGVTTYLYELDTDSLDQIRSIIDKRMDKVVEAAPILDYRITARSGKRNKKK